MLTLFALLALSGCTLPRPAKAPLPMELLPAGPGSPASRLIILLPGRGDHPESFLRHGVVDQLHALEPTADVLLLDAHLGYYLSRTLPERFVEDVAPVLESGSYEEVWIAGISLGGLGALFLDRDFPGTFDRLVLIAPFLGDDPDLLDALQRDGLARWTRTEPSATRDAFAHDLWEHLQENLPRQAYAERLWLAYGTEDRYAAWHDLLAAHLPAAQVLRADEGRHRWDTWKDLWSELVERWHGAD